MKCILQARLKGTSIDYGIMEKLKTQVCIPCDIGWSDVGSWDEVARLTPSTEPLVEERAKDNFVKGIEGKVYGLVGVEQLIVVDTPDALMVSRKGESQAVKEYRSKMRSKGTKGPRPKATFEVRPWGRFDVLQDTAHAKSKVIQVEPGQQISYQSHSKRAEHWIIVRGSPDPLVFKRPDLKAQGGQAKRASCKEVPNIEFGIRVQASRTCRGSSAPILARTI